MKLATTEAVSFNGARIKTSERPLLALEVPPRGSSRLTRGTLNGTGLNSSSGFTLVAASNSVVVSIGVPV